MLALEKTYVMLKRTQLTLNKIVLTVRRTHLVVM